jgi:hypothetical protein
MSESRQRLNQASLASPIRRSARSRSRGARSMQRIAQSGHSWNDERFLRRESEAAAPSHTCGTSRVRHSVRRAGILVGRTRGVGSLAHAARGPRRKYYGSLSFTGPFERPHAPGFKVRASRQSGPAKTQRRTTAKTKHRHTVVDPRRASTLTASSTFRIRSVLRECDCIPVEQQSASAYVVREIAYEIAVFSGPNIFLTIERSAARRFKKEHIV